MEQIVQQENKQGKRSRLLAAAVILLALALIAQTLYLFRLRSEHEKDVVQRQLLESRLKREAIISAEPRRAFVSGAADSWDPFAEIDRMQQSMNRMFQESFRRASLFAPSSGMTAVMFEPDIDIREQGNRYVITLDIPGMEKDRISVSVEGRALTVSGERRIEQESSDEQSGFYRMERQFGSFQRAVPLPEDADPESLKASYDKGVLRIELEKFEGGENNREARKIPVQ